MEKNVISGLEGKASHSKNAYSVDFFKSNNSPLF